MRSLGLAWAPKEDRATILHSSAMAWSTDAGTILRFKKRWRVHLMARDTFSLHTSSLHQASCRPQSGGMCECSALLHALYRSCCGRHGTLRAGWLGAWQQWCPPWRSAPSSRGRPTRGRPSCSAAAWHRGGLCASLGGWWMAEAAEATHSQYVMGDKGRSRRCCAFNKGTGARRGGS